MFTQQFLNLSVLNNQMAHLNNSLRTSLVSSNRTHRLFYEINIKATFLTFIHTLPCNGGNMDQSTDYYIAHWKLREKVKITAQIIYITR